mgnify:CR=1 FL=1
MPGHIIRVPFLEQIEDIDSCLKNSKVCKNNSNQSFSYSNSNRNVNTNSNNHANHVGYNYNNSYYYNKGNNTYYKKNNLNNGNSNNKNYANYGNNNYNYENYNKNYDYMKYNTRRNNNVNNMSGYPYNNSNMNNGHSSENLNNNYNSDRYQTYTSNGGNSDMNKMVAEQLKQTYPQIYENTHASMYSGAQPYTQSDYGLNQVTNNLGNLQLPENISQENTINHGSVSSTNGYSKTSNSGDFHNRSALNMFIPDSISGNNSDISNMTSFKSYIPSELLDSSTSTFPSNRNVALGLDNTVSNGNTGYIQRAPATSMASLSLGGNAISGTAGFTNDDALRFGSSPFAINNVETGNNIPSTAVSQQSQKSPFTSAAWGSNQMDIQSSIPGRSSINGVNNGSSSMFGIWNNDMSVWS